MCVFTYKYNTDTQTHTNNMNAMMLSTKNFDPNFPMKKLFVFWKNLYKNFVIVCRHGCTHEILNAKKRLRAIFLIIICFVYIDTAV